MQNRALSEQINKLKARVLDARRRISLERSLWYMKSYMETEGEPVPLRRARALEKILENISITVNEDEIIVGGRTVLPRSGVPAVEGGVDWLEEELDTISTREQEPFEVTAEDKALGKKIFHFFSGTTLKDYLLDRLPKDVTDPIELGVYTLNQTTHSQGHILPDTDTLLASGIGGLTKEVQKYRRSTPNPQKRIFYDAVLVTLDAASAFIGRYGEEADGRGMKDIADRCEKLATEPPDTFVEAVQLLWFLFVILHLESIGSSFSPGRLDQVLYPFFIRDTANETLSRESALDCIEALFIKFNEVVLLRSGKAAKYFAGFPIGFNVMLGGIDETGRAAENELSYLFLKAQADLGLPQPNLSVRVHVGSSDEFLRAAGFVIRKGSGMPQIFNDEAVIPALLHRGIEIEDARNYAAIGCVELGIPGKYLGLSDAALFNMPRLLEVTLREKTFYDFTSLEHALEENLEHYVEKMVEGCNIVDSAHHAVLPTPFLSSLVDNCLRKGVDVSGGGARYNFTGPQAVGIANIADSLYALKRLIFDTKEVAYPHLIEILDRNFKGEEMLRYRMLNRVPKYGNNIPDVDELAYRWSNLYNRAVEKYENPRGGRFQPGLYTVSAHVPLGMAVGATPDGRLAGEPLADGGLSPMRGRDRKGPLAVLQSVSRVDQIRASNGVLLNLKFHPSALEGDGGLARFTDLLRGFISLKNVHIQLNVVSADMLRKAQEKPEEYSDLVVRVAGYSAFFVDLNKALQDDIIERTEHYG
jgi:pyruvate formate-lyase/glycerol dehydratase family glycyl radical enzyme